MHVADRLVASIAATGSVACVGLDPRPALVPPPVRDAALTRHGDTVAAVAEAFLATNLGILEAVAGRCAVVKPQVACYEAYGTAGWDVLAATVERARTLGIPVIVDGKRNDIGSTAEHYRDAMFGGAPGFGGAAVGAGLGADWATVNAYLGSDGIDAFLDEAGEHGVFALVRTSNPSSADLQDVTAGDRTVAEHVADRVAAWGASRRGTSGLTAVGAVVGATWPDQARALRARMPDTVFLVPGFGAQGGTADDAVAGRRPGSTDPSTAGLVVNSSRELWGAWQRADSRERWQQATGEALDAMNRALAAALGSAA